LEYYLFLSNPESINKNDEFISTGLNIFVGQKHLHQILNRLDRPR